MHSELVNYAHSGKWEYLWQDKKAPMPDKTAHWHIAPGVHHLPGGKADQALWLRMKIPQVLTRHHLFLHGIDEHAIVYIHEKEVYRFGYRENGHSYFAGFAWIMIPLEPEHSDQMVMFKLTSNSRVLGISGHIFIAYPGLILEQMILRDGIATIIAFVHILIACLLVLFIWQTPQFLMFLYLALFALSSGIHILCRTEIKQLFLHMPWIWAYLEFASALMAAWFALAFVGVLFEHTRSLRWLTWAFGLNAAHFGVTFVLAFSQQFSLSTVFAGLELVGALNLILILYLILGSALRKDQAAMHILPGFMICFLLIGFEIYASYQLISANLTLFHWGILAFTVSLLLSLQQQLILLYRLQEQTQARLDFQNSFLAMMSHELRTPLNSILGFSKILLKNQDQKFSSSEIEKLNTIQRNSKHLLSLINNILDVSKLQAAQMDVQMERFLVNPLLQEIHQIALPLAENRHNQWQIIQDINPEFTLESDPDRLRQILLNLIANACKFTENGSVVLKVSCTVNEIVFDVEDTGIGIKEEDQSKIFEAFTQIETKFDRRFEGTGLGLTICQQFAHLLNGSIHCQSQSGKGSTFTLRLPLN